MVTDDQTNFIQRQPKEILSSLLSLPVLGLLFIYWVACKNPSKTLMGGVMNCIALIWDPQCRLEDELKVNKKQPFTEAKDSKNLPTEHTHPDNNTT